MTTGYAMCDCAHLKLIGDLNVKPSPGVAGGYVRIHPNDTVG